MKVKYNLVYKVAIRSVFKDERKQINQINQQSKLTKVEQIAHAHTHTHRQKFMSGKSLPIALGSQDLRAREDSLLLEYRETDHCISVAKIIPAHTKQSTEV